MKALVLVLAAALLVACDDGGSDPPGTPDGGPRQVVMETRSLLVGDVVEATLTGGPADSATLTLMAPVAKLDWNIHGHAGGGSQTIKEEFDVMSTSYTFVPPGQAPWSLLLRNRHTAPMSVEITIELYGEMQWRGWQ